MSESKKELKALKAEMKLKGIRKVSPFNGGLTSDEARYNQKRFALETKIKNEN